MAKASTRRPQSPISPGAMGRINPVTFVQEVISELRKTVWPSRAEVARLTAVVIVLAAVVGVFLGGLDRAFSEIFTRIVFR